MTDERNPRRPSLPRAFLLALAIPLLVSGLTWLVVVRELSTTKHTVLLLGDSNIANFRLLPGERLEDVLSSDLGPDWVVRNWGEIGADPADQYFMLCRAELLRFHPDVVVLALSAHAFIPDTTGPGHRFREDGDGLRWLRWNEEGYRFLATLTARERQKAVVSAAEPIFGFYDAYRALTLHSDWPRLRANEFDRTPELQALIVASYSKKISEYLDAHVDVGSYAEFSARPKARDFGFFAEALRARRTPFLVVVLPAAQPKVLAESFSEKTRGTLERAYEYTLRVLEEHGVTVQDHNTVEERAKFDSSQYGDHYHLKSPAAFRYLARGIADWISRVTPPEPRPRRQ